MNPSLSFQAFRCSPVCVWPSQSFFATSAGLFRPCRTPLARTRARFFSNTHVECHRAPWATPSTASRLTSKRLASSSNWRAPTAWRDICRKIRPNLVDVPRARTASILAAPAVSDTGSTSSFPEKSSKAVAYWLLLSAGSVFGIVVFGGLTRLTESGLSITEWKPVTGSFPPRDDQAWESEFALYRASPEFALLNRGMTLQDFKEIYWMEWTHRLWGRFIGVTFLLPTIYFIGRRRVSARTARRLVSICGLIGFQGFIGWWMVKSGLRDELFEPGSHPRVSQYRLATHLGTAFVCYSAMLWSGLSVLRAHRSKAIGAEAALRLTSQLASPAMRRYRIVSTGLLALIFTTAMSGALVAGLDAGLIYNEFPYMGNGLTPPKSELFDSFYSRDPGGSDLIWRNMFENPSLVQLNHRIMAMTTFTSVIAFAAWTRYSKSLRPVLARETRRAVTRVFGMAWVQVALGLSTLLYLVPTPVAAAHQAGALGLLTTALLLASSLRPGGSRALAAASRSVLRSPGGAQKRSFATRSVKTGRPSGSNLPIDASRPRSR